MPRKRTPAKASETRPPRRRARWVRFAPGALVLGMLLVLGANLYVISARDGHLHTSVDATPATEVGLVLGCAPTLNDGRPNPYFEHRLDAAAALYRAGKVHHLLVSGANPSPDYDEPSAMRAGLVARGVPADAITCDFAGRRTLDSVVRAKDVFGLSRCTIVSQAFHLDRALLIAAHHGLAAEGLVAQDVDTSFGLRTELREVLARTWVVTDLYVFDRQPRFDGPPEPIREARLAPKDSGDANRPASTPATP